MTVGLLSESIVNVSKTERSACRELVGKGDGTSEEQITPLERMGCQLVTHLCLFTLILIEKCLIADPTIFRNRLKAKVLDPGLQV